MKRTSLNRMISISLFSTIAFLIMYISFPLPLFPIFLKVDFSDIPAVIGAIIYGPAAGVLIEALKNLLHYLTKGSMTGIPIGEAANFAAGSLLVVITSIIYRKNPSVKNLISGLLAATICMTVIMSIANYYFIFPAYAMFLGFPIDTAVQAAKSANNNIHDLMTLIVYGVMPFNLLKGIMLTFLTLPVYLRLRHRFHWT